MRFAEVRAVGPARAVIPPSLDDGTLAPLVSPDGNLDDGETALTTSSMHAAPGSFFGPGVIGSVATLGAVAAGAAIVEAALIPGLLIGAAAVLAPRLLPRDVLSGLAEKPGGQIRRAAPSPVRSAPTAPSAAAPVSGEPASFDTWRAVVKTFTYRVAVTTIDFGANYFVIGEFATAAGLSSLSLVAGPIAYFAHEAAWHYLRPGLGAACRSARGHGACADSGAAEVEDNGRTRFASVKVSRAVAKTITYEVVTGVSEFGANYLFVRDLAAAAGLTAFSIVIAPFVYYAARKGLGSLRRHQTIIGPSALKLLPAAQGGRPASVAI